VLLRHSQDAERFPHASNHRLLIDEHLRVKGHQDVYALGDCAVSETVPMMATAQVAHQQGAYLADAFSKPDPSAVQPFKFHYLGLMAYIGRYQGLVETPDVQISGTLAWLSWRSVYLTRLGSWKSKIQVPFDWLRTFLFGRDVTTF
jgi:NADH:quinone reductase (non-electrogenic)